MPPLPPAVGYLDSSLLTILIPLGLLIGIAIWYVVAVKRVPSDTAASSLSLPPREMVEAAGADVVADITLEADVTPIDPAADEP
jgi:hypothetical protein